jgi:hypothetical protein
MVLQLITSETLALAGVKKMDMGLVDNFKKLATFKYKTNNGNVNIIFDTIGMSANDIDIFKTKLKNGGVNMTKVDFIDSSKVKVQQY